MRSWLAVAIVLVTSSAEAAPDPITAKIDSEVAAAWSAHRVTPAPPTSDAEFLRRVTLDLAGRVPTRAEATAYLSDKAPTKKIALVDRLLASPDWAQHMADVYFALLIGREFKLGPAYIDSVRDFLVKSFAANLPYDQLATKIVTATGDISEHGEIGFLFAHAARGGSPEAVAGATARIFLGVQLQCAQCHDHPYDPRYKQKDFYGLVAFFARTRGRLQKDGDLKTLEVYDVPNGEALMTPHGYTFQRLVYPSFLGHKTDLPDGEARRPALARAIVTSDLFAKAAANHAWAQLFGRGIVEPWDDLGGEHDDGHPPLLVTLAADFVASHYDLRHLFRAIALSDAYGRAGAGGAGDDADKLFARAPVRALTPEQLFHSLLAVTRIENAARKYKLLDEDELHKKLEQGLKQFMFIFGDDEMGQVDRASGNMPQALLVLNGELTNLGTKAAQGSELRAILDENQGADARIDALYLSSFSRRPSAAERARFTAYLSAHGDKPQTYEDLFYALVTSTEFTTNH